MGSPVNRGRLGAVLLEVLAALSILGIAGLALTTVLSEAVDVARRAAATERSLEEADRLLTATSLLTREDLMRRVGRRQIGEFVVEVQRPEPGLYRVAVEDTGRVVGAGLVTVLYRPEARP